MRHHSVESFLVILSLVILRPAIFPQDYCVDAATNAVTSPLHCWPEEQRKELLASLIQMANSTLTDFQVHKLPQLLYHIMMCFPAGAAVW